VKVTRDSHHLEEIMLDNLHNQAISMIPDGMTQREKVTDCCCHNKQSIIFLAVGFAGDRS
jgi:hypothetical protein